MIRLCVIGNSHMAAYKLGWDVLTSAEKSARHTLSPTFFGAPRDGIRQIEQQSGRLVPTRKDIADNFERLSGGLREINLAEYDAFLLVGLNVSIKRMLRFYKTHFWYGLKPDQERTMVPVSFALDFLAERYSNTLLAETAAKVRSGTNAPIIAVAEPYWASWVREDNGNKPDYGWDEVIRNGDAESLSMMFHKSVTNSLDGSAVFVPQAHETVVDGIMTRPDFNKEASRLITGEGGGTDAAHMNGEFGRAMWQLIARVAIGLDLSAAQKMAEASNANAANDPDREID